MVPVTIDIFSDCTPFASFTKSGITYKAPNIVFTWRVCLFSGRGPGWNNFGNNDGAKESRIIPEF